jgi:hypothetical protein
MAKSYIAISAVIFAVTAIAHLVRIGQGWQVQLVTLALRCLFRGAALAV